jgi:Ca2+-binding RTX toxin-like protein
VGEGGNDVYIIDSRDTIIEVQGGGIDRVEANFSYTLGSNLENLTLTGSAAINGAGNTLNNVIIGNAAANWLGGGAGNDTLDGGRGRDTLSGGFGDDTYLTEGTDVVTEVAGGGIDHVISTGTTWLRANVENLTLAGAAAIDATGNALNNRLVGNAANNLLSGWEGNDTLEGGAGADTLVGGAGNDTYIVDPFDTLVEAKWQGLDLVISAYSYRLGVNFENLTLVGNGHITATGNALNNVLTGNAGNNILDGGAGQDTLIGGAGNDTYYTNSGETFIELADEGIDHVFASVTHSLFANIENLTLTGVWNTNALGNNLDNILTGNSGANRLDGGAGNDTLNGGLGNDTFLGGAGADCFVFNATLGTTNVDTIVDFNVVEDMIHLENAIFTGLASGTLAASAFTANLSGLATSFTQRIIYETDTGKLFFDADGSGSRAAVHFADLQPALALTSADFFVF